MTGRVGMGYAMVRMQARLARHPTGATWRELSRIRDAGQLLARLRGTALAQWVADLAADSSPHQIERGLRNGFRAELGALASWLPAPWRAAVRRLALVPYLFLAAHRRDGLAPPDWMHDDPVGRLLSGDERPRADAERDLWRLATSGAGAAEGLTDQWFRAWRRALPAEGSTPLQRLAGELPGLLSEPAASPDAPAAQEARLRRTFRAYPRSPVAVLAYVGLVHLQLRQARAALLRARLFADPA